MTRIKRGYVARQRRNKIINFAKGFVGSHHSIFRAANQQIMKAFRYSYNDRRKKKNNFRLIWIKRINIACLTKQFQYNKTINKLKLAKILLNKKILSSLISNDINTFNEILDKKYPTF